jgi:serine/threonine-protein kinase HipA
MMMTTKTSALAIHLHGTHIGTIARLSGARTIFSFEQSYVDDDERATLSLSFRAQSGDLLTDHRAYRAHLMPFFSNLLPEGVLRQYLANRAKVSEHAEFDLLEKLGTDLPGAVTARPIDGEWPEKADDKPESDQPAGPTSERMRFSLAGVQLKFSALENKGKEHGLTIPVDGSGGSWIVKLPSAKHNGVPENEFAMMDIARHVGIDIPDIRLIKLADIDGLPDDIEKIGDTAFAIKRFDRTAAGAVHIEDFAQVFGVYPAGKYDKASYRNILAVIAQVSDQDSAIEFMRRLVFSTLIGNGDMHLKNWSLIYPDGRAPILSPAYDLLSTLPYVPGDDTALKFARIKRFAEFTRDEIAYMAAKTGLPETPLMAAADETVERFMDYWSKEKTNIGVASDVVDHIDRHLTTLAILTE